MSFWSWMNNTGPRGEKSNANPPSSVGPDYEPGDPDGLEFIPVSDVSTRSGPLPFISPSAWSGYPEQWSTPNFNTQAGLAKLVDVAWACLDLNSNVLSAMPVYRTQNGQIIDPVTWMTNPDPDTYTSWQEFAKQLFWDYQLGEAFVLPMGTDATGYPSKFRVIPPWLMTVEMRGATREYKLGSMNVTDEVLHIRYKSTTIHPRGQGPLDAAGARMTTIGLLQRYADNLAETGGVPHYWIGVDRKISRSEAVDLVEGWIETRAKYAGYPAFLGSGSKLNQAQSMNARDMTLMELSQFSESRVAVLLGVPPFLVGLAGAQGSLTYSNIADLFDFHDRSSLRPKARAVMEPMSGWALPRGQACELNRDDYTRLPVDKRYNAYAVAIEAGFLLDDEVRTMERWPTFTASQREQAALAALIAQGKQPLEPAAPAEPGQPAAPAQPTPIQGGQNGKSLTAAKSLTGGAN